jgi:hypothetical protein
MPNFSETLDFYFCSGPDVVVGLLYHHATNVAPRPPSFMIAKYHPLRKSCQAKIATASQNLL